MAETNRPLWVVRSNSDVFVITFGEKENGEVNKDIDSINILDRATPPLSRSSPNRRFYLFVGAVVGFLLATAVALFRPKHIVA